MSTSEPADAFFTTPDGSAGGDTFVPTEQARGPWGGTVGGQLVSGLLGWAVERDAGDPDFLPARLTVDLLRPTFMEPVRIQTTVQREGKRIKVADVTLFQRDTVVSRASAVFLRRTEEPDTQVWSPPLEMPPLPEEPAELPPGLPMFMRAYGTNPTSGGPGLNATEWQQSHNQKFAWIRQTRPLVNGAVATPFTRAVMCAEVTSPLTHWGTGGLRHINADYTLTLSRLPDSEYIGLAAMSQHSSAGIATGTATVFDVHGPIGTAVAVALAQPPEAFSPRISAV
ncbi:MAG: acyl-CoA thioesterase domain-containing protein [Mycobacterium sp.]